MIALTAAALFTPLSHVDQPMLLIEDGLVVECCSRAKRDTPGSCRIIDFGDAILVPGFLDIHIHGGGGCDVMDAAPDSLAGVEQQIARHGVTGFFPTTVTASVDATLAALERLADAIEQTPPRQEKNLLRARPLGIHLEGPFISHKRRGVHPEEYLLPPSVEMFERFWNAARGHIRMITLAPELPGALEVIASARNRNVCVSFGHTDATLEESRMAVDAGARHSTHTFNAMRPLLHRDPGILGDVLTDQRISADFIADGIHLDPSIVKMIVAAKGVEATVLITDATAATGMPDGNYKLGSLEIEVKNGRCLRDGTLAGSVLTMDRAVSNVMSFAGLDLQSAIRLATINPARVAGLDQRGSLAAGSAADVVVLSSAGEVRQVIIGGAGV
ncbi:MAG: N-acetylglucosamine-6-phosphate deacetylase [Acidobacteriales bacterium]|nr:N-acetylglucosamine-6-phosphate deacetylase [Terriglobales bacterium]